MGCFTLIFMIFGAMFFGVSAVQTSQPPTVLEATAPEPITMYDEIPQYRTEDGAFVLGNPDAPVTIVAFEDFLCPHCQNYQPEIHAFIREYVVTGQASFEFRMLPISQLSPITFALAECSHELSPRSFWPAHDTIFHITSTTGLTENIVTDFSNIMDIPYADLLTCLETADQYLTDAALAMQYDEITGTPAVAWRLNDGELRFDVISRQPTALELGALIETYSQ